MHVARRGCCVTASERQKSIPVFLWSSNASFIRAMPWLSTTETPPTLANFVFRYLLAISTSGHHCFAVRCLLAPDTERTAAMWDGGGCARYPKPINRSRGHKCRKCDDLQANCQQAYHLNTCKLTTAPMASVIYLPELCLLSLSLLSVTCSDQR